MKHRFLLLTALATGLLATLPATAQFAKPEDAIKYRQSSLSVMAAHFGRVGAMANGRVPFDAKAAADNAEIAAYLSKLPWAGFGAGTEGGKAKAEIWKEQEKFKELSEKMQAEMTKLNAAAKTGNLDNLKAAFGPTAASCKACHDAYQNK
jgi:cytochrome c556